jgi:hypothetical protein
MDSSAGLRPGIEVDELAEALQVAQSIMPTRVAKLVGNLIAGDSLSREEVWELVAIAADHRCQKLTQSRLAAWALGRLGLSAASRTEVARRIERSLKPDPFSDLLGATLTLALTTSVGMCLAAYIVYALQVDPIASFTQIAVSIAPKLLPFTTFHAYSVVAQRRHCTVRNVLRALGRLGSVDSIPALARAYWDGPLSWSGKLKREHREIAAKSLKKLLGIISSDALSPAPQGLSSDLLKLSYSTDYKLVEATIRALGVVGDRRAIDRVRDCAAAHVNPEVRAAAEIALPAIEERAKRKSNQQALLRPFEASSSDLLRPLSGLGTEDHDSLVRPADADAILDADEQAQRVTHV